MSFVVVPLKPLAANSDAAVRMMLAWRSRAEARLPFDFVAFLFIEK
jgi:hypothetical protein